MYNAYVCEREASYNKSASQTGYTRGVCIDRRLKLSGYFRCFVKIVIGMVLLTNHKALLICIVRRKAKDTASKIKVNCWENIQSASYEILIE